MSRSISSLRARASTPPSELFVNAILSSHEVMRFLRARGKSPCNKNSSSNSTVHNKSLFLLAAVEGRISLARTHGTTRRTKESTTVVGEDGRETRDAGYTRSRENCPLYYVRDHERGGMIYKRDNWKCHEWLHAGSWQCS